jgi:hypothetical protein
LAIQGSRSFAALEILKRDRRHASASASDIWRPLLIAVTAANFGTGSTIQFKTKWLRCPRNNRGIND